MPAWGQKLIFGNDGYWLPAQPVDATLYPETERCGLWRLVKDIFEAS
jgi:hypothetical protein